MNQLISKRSANQRFSLLLLISFAAIAILLAAVGLYGLVSHSTAQRTSEFGLRLALGAQPQDLVRMVLRQGLSPALLGMAVGLLSAIAAVRVMRSMLFEVKPLDIAVFASVGCLLLLLSFAASLIPALRTTGVDPAQTLRAE